MKILYSLMIFILGSAPWNISMAGAAQKTYTIAVVPQFTSIQVYRDWTPLLEKLQMATGYHFELKVFDDFARFESAVEKGIPDLVYMNPYHMVVAKQKQNYRPLLRDSATLSGILVTRLDSPIKNLADLNGKSIAFPSPNALGASLYIRALLAEKVQIRINPVYVNGHQNVYRQVILGDVAAGGGVKKTLDKEANAVKSELKVIFSTPEISSHPLAAHPRIPSSVSKKIVAALLALRNDPESEKLLSAVQLPQPVEADFKRDYSDLIKLKLDRYAVTQTK